MKQDMIVILDLGSHENTVLARAIRALGVYSEIYPHDITVEELKALPNVKGIIINGGPNNVIDGVAIDVNPGIYEMGTPVMAAGHDKALCEVKLPEFTDDVEAIKGAVKSFVFDTCKAEANWNMTNFVNDQIELVKRQVGDKKVLLALSGGVDSSVVAALLLKAIGDKLVCVHVNHGLMRKGESEDVVEVFKNQLNANLVYVDATDRFLDKLADVEDPEQKRKIIGGEFIRVFEEEARKLDGIDFLAQGTIYPDFLLKERKAGRIRNLGWSFHGDVKVFDYLLSLDIPWDFVQIQLNYVDWKNASGWNVNAEYLYGELEKRNIPVVIMEPLLGGRLSRLNALSLAKLKQMRPDDSPASWAFRYAGSPKGVLTVLSGMVYMEHLQENIRTFSPLEPITEQENKALEEVTERMLHSDFVPCTECQYCMPCPYGLDIPGTFAHYNRCVNDELVAKSSQDANYREARRAFLVGYDRKVPKLRQAGHCIGCDKCVPKCPQGIKIPEQMRKIDQYVEQLKQETL